MEGITAIRKMHIRSLRDSHLPAADEMLYPDNYAYLEDVLSYVAVGARSVENQAHRLTCSGLAGRADRIFKHVFHKTPPSKLDSES